MVARVRSLWKQIKSHPIIALLIPLLAALFLTILIGGYRFQWAWTGLTEDKETYKTLYDWMQLLIIPLFLAVIALLFNRATTRTEQKIAQDRYEQDKEIASRHYHQDRQIAHQRYQNDRNIALDKQREDLLQTFLDRMSDLLLDKQLRTSERDSEVRNVARVRTITILTQLDGRRIGHVFAFLREAELMSTASNDNVVSLDRADFQGVNWSKANLSDANLVRARLFKANFSETFIVGADFNGADLFRANLIQSTLNFTNLSGADLRGADLSGANLSGANLSKAEVADEQLKKAKSLKGATMPDGSIHP